MMLPGASYFEHLGRPMQSGDFSHSLAGLYDVEGTGQIRGGRVSQDGEDIHLNTNRVSDLLR